MPSYETVGDIKSAAEENARKAGRGASATSLLNSAKDQIARANVAENEGNLKEAFICLMKAVTVLTMGMATTEYKQESKKHGVLFQQFSHFMQVSGLLPGGNECCSSLQSTKVRASRRRFSEWRVNSR